MKVTKLDYMGDERQVPEGLMFLMEEETSECPLTALIQKIERVAKFKSISEEEAQRLILGGKYE